MFRPICFVLSAGMLVSCVVPLTSGPGQSAARSPSTIASSGPGAIVPSPAPSVVISHDAANTSRSPSPSSNAVDVIEIKADKFVAFKGESVDLDVHVSPQLRHSVDVVASDQSRAKVSSDGEVVMLDAGPVELAVAAGGQRATALFAVVERDGLTFQIGSVGSTGNLYMVGEKLDAPTILRSRLEWESLWQKLGRIPDEANQDAAPSVDFNAFDLVAVPIDLSSVEKPPVITHVETSNEKQTIRVVVPYYLGYHAPGISDTDADTVFVFGIAKTRNDASVQVERRAT